MINIPVELKAQVNFSVTILGRAIKNLYGDTTFNLIESIRKELVGMHNVDTDKQFNILFKINTQLKKVTKKELPTIAHAYLTMLELINRCEAAHRIFKLNNAPKKAKELITKLDQEIIYVLTSHPTEAKSPKFLESFEKIQKILVKLYDVSENKKILELELYHLLYLALSIPAAKNRAPKVEDEANMIYSFLLNPKLLDKILASDLPIFFRTWVGGDKDGHPGVDHRTLKESLTLSRNYLIHYVNLNLTKLLTDSKLLNAPKIVACKKNFKELLTQLNQLKRVLPQDYIKVEKFKKSFLSSSNRWHQEFGEKNFNLVNIEKLFQLYPQLVVPIEVREDSEFVKESLTSRKTFAIVKMLQFIKSIASFNTCKSYVRGFILSMVETEEDLFNGAKLTKKIFGSLWLPVVPLFENRKALENCEKIIKTYLTKETVQHHQKYWNSNFEIMLGYSDSSKECGVFPSRVLIYEAMRSLDLLLRGKNLHPVFFHGSGGSVTVEEPLMNGQHHGLSSLRIVKTTIQGEIKFALENFSDEITIFSKQNLNRNIKILIEQRAYMKFQL
ncbi:MAG: phosphoenolpyruvate carboxylase [Bacteriovoracaceae bacterium]